MDESQLFRQLEKVREFQMSDLRKADELARANFLVCVGCLNATETLGGIKTATIGVRGQAEPRFAAGIEVLGDPYPAFHEELWDLRNSMVHAYLGKSPKHPNILIGANHEPNAPKYPAGVQVVKDSYGEEVFLINVSAWRVDLESAWRRLLADLRNNRAVMTALAALFDKQPWLL